MRRLLLIAGFIVLWQGTAIAQGISPHEDLAVGRVVRIISTQDETFEGIHRLVQQLELRIESGAHEGVVFVTENGVLDAREDMLLHEGQRVVVHVQILSDGSVRYLIQERYRLPALGWLVGAFIALSVLLGGLVGLTSLAGLAMSVVVLMFYVIPHIVAGGNPLTTGLVGCILIACTSLYLAHGFRRRTSVALLSTIVTLMASVVLSVLSVRFAHLFGMGSEESLYLQSGLLQGVDLKGLLLCGMLLGCLGVLDDITTAQTAAVDEIRRANPSMSVARLMQAGRSVGREHIASLINTLVLAYAGASLPLLLLFYTQGDYPMWATLNSEFLAEEIVRTLVGSATLLLAVPISTAFAVWLLRGNSSSGHGHIHHHH